MASPTQVRETKAAVKRRTPNDFCDYLECGALPPLLFPQLQAVANDFCDCLGAALYRRFCFRNPNLPSCRAQQIEPRPTQEIPHPPENLLRLRRNWWVATP
jgi:hypothetical protein